MEKIGADTLGVTRAPGEMPGNIRANLTVYRFYVIILVMDSKVILAVDDNPAVLAVIRSILKDHYNVLISKSAPMAMNILKTMKADLILLDIEMPGMSGFEFLHEIRKDPKCMKIPVLVVSSHAGDEFRKHAESSGATALVAKPINAETLLQKIGEALASPVGGILTDL
jgi:CheY-like chemotaxis protein